MKEKKFIVRCKGAGVFFGDIIERNGDMMDKAAGRQTLKS